MQILFNQHKFNNVSTLKNTNFTKQKNSLSEKKDFQLSSVYYPVFTSSKMKTIPTKLERFEGCLLGGAIGDAFGAPIEFMKMNKIKRLFGPQGFTDFNKNRLFSFTDDTQLTIFTADGLIKSALKNKSDKVDYDIIFNSYLDWYKLCALGKKTNSGWISKIENLRGTNGSGKTCMDVFSKNLQGSIKNPLNQSRTCGGVMRVAPVGLVYNNSPQKAFDIAANCAALSHGHPDAYLSAGFHAAIIANLVNDITIDKAINNSLAILKTKENSEPLLTKIEKAIDLAKKESDISELGLGWNGDEAIAMAIFSVIKNPSNYKQTIITAANHSGDSDTVAAIAGGISGTYLGINSIPKDLIEKINLKKSLLTIANDLNSSLSNIKHSKKRYPVKFTKEAVNEY